MADGPFIMTGRIYLLNGDSELMPMVEAPYDSERILQELLADYPDLLAGEQINSDHPRRWLLVTREMSVSGEFDGAARWSLDHLFLDQDAVPTLVEVKRSSDTRIRREVVGQMLDYAANAVAYWPVEEIRAKFENRCIQNELDVDDVLAGFLEPGQAIDEFWQQAKTNLQAGRIRMVFIADIIPVELRRVVEFLNEQMDPAEVLAIEVKQFVGKSMKTLVPRVLGQTETARQKKSSGVRATKQWDETLFLDALARQKGEAVKQVAKDILHWIAPLVTRVWWGTGAKEGGLIPMIEKGDHKYHICRMSTEGRFVFRFDWLCKKPPFDNPAARSELLSKINQIPDIQFGEEVLTKRVRIPLTTLADPIALSTLKEAVEWLINHVEQCVSVAKTT